MIKSTNFFEQFLSSYEEDVNGSIDYNEEFRSILVYIGLITICLLFLLLIYSLINKCIKMFQNETIPITKIKHQQRYYTNRFTNNQISMSSISSSVFLLNYQSSKTLSPIVHV